MVNQYLVFYFIVVETIKPTKNIENITILVFLMADTSSRQQQQQQNNKFREMCHIFTLNCIKMIFILTIAKAIASYEV